MAGITLEIAQQHLTESLEALSAARRALNWGASDQNVGRERVSDLQRQVDYWQRQVNALTATARGRKNGALFYPRWQ